LSDEGGGGRGKRRRVQAGLPSAASQESILAAVQAACAQEALALLTLQVGTRHLLTHSSCLHSNQNNRHHPQTTTVYVAAAINIAYGHTWSNGILPVLTCCWLLL
jgi:hypothetical protein